MVNRIFLTIDNNEYETWSALDAVALSFDPGHPAPKTYTQDIPYGNGEVDNTEYYGEVHFENRTVKMSFAVDAPNKQEAYDRFVGLFHGKNIQVRTSVNPEYYFKGRATVEKLDTDDWKFDVSVNAKPYKYIYMTDEKMGL